MESKSQFATSRTTHAPSSNSIFLWKNPVRSGIVLAQLLAAVTVARYGQPLRFVLKGSALALLSLAAIEHFSRIYTGRSASAGTTRRGWVSSMRPSRYLSVSDAQREKIAHKLSTSINTGLSHLHTTVDAVDTKHTAVMGVIAGLMFLLLGFVSMTTLLYIGIIGAFSVPKLYSMYQREIDQALDKAKQQAGAKYNDVHSQVMKAAGPHIEQAKTHVNAMASKVGYSSPLTSPTKPTVTSKPTVTPTAKSDILPTDMPSELSPEPEMATKSSGSDFTFASEKPATLQSSSHHDAAPRVLVGEGQNDDQLTAGIADSYKTVPTMMGTVSLDPSASSEPIESQIRSQAGKFTESEVN